MFEVLPIINQVLGFRVAGVHAGLKPDGAADVSLIVSDMPCTAAGVFTTNTVKAACVLHDMQSLITHSQSIRAVVMNSKVANACTGQQGLTNAHLMAAEAAQQVGCAPEQVLVLSTGVIGQQLPMDKIRLGVQLASDRLGNDWETAARGIMTTDTRPKMASIQVTLSDGNVVTLAGISKGAGMIAPNMATMLGVIVTDAVLTTNQAQALLVAANNTTFNRIVIDGDMSTNDTVLLLANGASQVALTNEADERLFQAALMSLSRKLAQDIVRDGEGVTKFVTVHVANAGSIGDARQIANTIATSALVKTAFFGSDANWGRIIAAAGRSGVPFDPTLAVLEIQVGEYPENVTGDTLRLFEKGVPTNYEEPAAMQIMTAPEISVLLDCGLGRGEATIWTCDLSYDYVKINGDYRT